MGGANEGHSHVYFVHTMTARSWGLELPLPCKYALGQLPFAGRPGAALFSPGGTQPKGVSSCFLHVAPPLLQASLPWEWHCLLASW